MTGIPTHVTATIARQTAFGFRYFLHLPDHVDHRTPLLVSVHGISRNAAFHAAAFGEHAARRGVAVAAPCFDRDTYRRYQRIWQKGTSGRADLALEAMLDDIRQSTGIATDRFLLSGYSGGAQFAHRYAMCRPERVLAMGLAAAGWYCFPDTDAPYPRGLKGFSAPGLRPAIPFALRVPVLVAVGERDHVRDEALRITSAIDRQQGLNRITRGQAWLANWQQMAEQRGLDTPSRFDLLPRTGHAFDEAIDPARGNYAERFLDFAEACGVLNSRPEVEGPSPRVPCRQEPKLMEA